MVPMGSRSSLNRIIYDEDAHNHNEQGVLEYWSSTQKWNVYCLNTDLSLPLNWGFVSCS